MKLTTIVLASAVVLLLQVGMPLAQEVTNTTLAAAPEGYTYCSRARCRQGYDFDYGNCKCTQDSKSKCPRGFSRVTIGKGYCVCKRVVNPHCPDDWDFASSTCHCIFRRDPSCPDYTTLTKYGRHDKCIGKIKRKCAPGYKLDDDCSCVAYVPRFCEDGVIIASGCKCKKEVKPHCRDNRCTLNTETCYCQRRISNPYRCFPRRNCRGLGQSVGSVSHCCDGSPKSYRFQGSCHQCRTYKRYALAEDESSSDDEE